MDRPARSDRSIPGQPTFPRAHDAVFLFDAGVFRAIRPRGPLDSEAEADGPALETLVLQHLRAWTDYGSLGYSIHYWRTPEGDEVDFVLYGRRGLTAIEVQRSARIRQKDLIYYFRESSRGAKILRRPWNGRAQAGFARRSEVGCGEARAAASRLPAL